MWKSSSSSNLCAKSRRLVYFIKFVPAPRSASGALNRVGFFILRNERDIASEIITKLRCDSGGEMLRLSMAA